MTSLETTAPAGRYPYLADAGRQIDQLNRLLAWENGQRNHMHVDRDPDVLEQLADGGYVTWGVQSGYTLTGRGRDTVLKLAALDAHAEQERREAAADATEVFDTVPDETAAEQTAINPVEGTLPGRHRIVRKSRWARVRAHFTIARAAALSASVGVLVGIGFMWLVTR